MPSSTSASRATVSDVTIRMSLVQTKVKVYNVADRSEQRDTAFELVCPVCKEAHVTQLYTCQKGCLPDESAPAEHGIGWRTSEIGVRGRWEGDELVATATTDEVAAIKQAANQDSGVEEKVLDLAFYPAAEVDANMAESGNTYCLLPHKGDADAVYQILMEKAADPDIAIIAAFVVRDKVNIYRFHAGRQGLLLREMLRPEETHSFELAVGKAPTEKERGMFEGLVEILIDTFNPEDYRSGRTAALKELIAEKSGTAGATITPIAGAKGKSKPAEDLEATLEAALALAAAKKKTA